MPAVSFSLTEKVIIDPILILQAPIPPLEPGQRLAWTATAWQAIQSEVIARIVAIFTSVFAAVDAFVHLLAGLYNGVFCLTSSYHKSKAFAHFQQALWFSGLAAIGSIAGLIWPGLFKDCRYSPPSPSDDFQDAPPQIKKLAKAVQEEEETAPFDQLKQFWRESSLEDKHWFVRVFNSNGTESFKNVRVEMASTAYRQHNLYVKNRQVKWLSEQELDQRVIRIWAGLQNHSFFYHATSESSLESILKSKRVEVRHEKLFRGAFVSTQPETGFGRCIFAFKRTIERLSSLEHGFRVGPRTYWAGFSRNIPVTESTLAYIILDGGDDRECNDLEARCKQWTSRPIKVIPLRDAEAYLRSVQNTDMGIPAEWPSENDPKAPQILRSLRARAAVAVQQIAIPKIMQRMAVAY